jgi:hypothetical protein
MGPKGPSVRLEEGPQRAAEARGANTGPGEAGDSSWQRLGQDPLVRRADGVAAPSGRPPPRKEGPTARCSARLDGPGLLADLSATLTVVSCSFFSLALELKV